MHHLTQRRVLAADLRHVGATQILEPLYRWQLAEHSLPLFSTVPGQRASRHRREL
jgi:hypothetical protein